MNILRTKRVFKMKKIHFSSYHIKKAFLEANETVFGRWVSHFISGLARFDPAQSNSKKRLKGSDCPKWIVSWKATNKISMYLWAPFILPNFKKFLEPIQRYEDVPFLGSNNPFVLNETFLAQTIITFIYLLTLTTVQNLKKFLQQIQSYEDVPFY